ncbi:hypothetical protein SEA_RASPUTIA_16 [Microbacterium phage Rasputia]|nr:hypothetical protein SEA_RASPUTIA_16 [Microbacterium phage Rasputia]
MTSRGEYDWGHQQRTAEMDAAQETARKNQEAIHGERYWERPVETTGPKDPHPGHHHTCYRRLGHAQCTCPEPRWV